jgi:hypothetical protein
MNCCHLQPLQTIPCRFIIIQSFISVNKIVFESSLEPNQTWMGLLHKFASVDFSCIFPKFEDYWSSQSHTNKGGSHKDRLLQAAINVLVHSMFTYPFKFLWAQYIKVSKILHVWKHIRHPYSHGSGAEVGKLWPMGQIQLMRDFLLAESHCKNLHIYIY